MTASIDTQIAACNNEPEALMNLYQKARYLWIDRKAVDAAIRKCLRPKIASAKNSPDELIELLRYTPSASNIRKEVLCILDSCVDRIVREHGNDREQLQKLHDTLPRNVRLLLRVRRALDCLP